mmetsp:Transcript_29080/g.52721  ORF Transcript_29080/g.52721 Transcript_29080/m.52721 type:complete len:289 (+) Transcript_29080:78-944(+)
MATRSVLASASPASTVQSMRRSERKRLPNILVTHFPLVRRGTMADIQAAKRERSQERTTVGVRQSGATLTLASVISRCHQRPQHTSRRPPTRASLFGTPMQLAVARTATRQSPSRSQISATRRRTTQNLAKKTAGASATKTLMAPLKLARPHSQPTLAQLVRHGTVKRAGASWTLALVHLPSRLKSLIAMERSQPKVMQLSSHMRPVDLRSSPTRLLSPVSQRIARKSAWQEAAPGMVLPASRTKSWKFVEHRRISLTRLSRSSCQAALSVSRTPSRRSSMPTRMSSS